MPSFIADGYVFRAGIDAVDDEHDGIEFTYRPMTPSETAEYQHEIMNESGKKLRRIQARWLLKKIQKWSMKDGSDLPELEESVLVDGNKDGQFINSKLLSRMIGIVNWGDAPDYGDKVDAAELAGN